MKDFLAHFFQGTRICSRAYTTLVANRKDSNQRLKQETIEGGDENKAKVFDQVQYALKSNANSMHVIISFAQYNTYGPRCGMSITARGRWALHVTCPIISGLGFDVLYGYIDSVGFTLKHNGLDMFHSDR